MLETLDGFIRGSPAALLFAVLGLGSLVGRANVRGIELGTVSGVLFVGLAFGHFGYEFSSAAQTIGFVLFIFSVGLQAGPSFFSVLRQDGLRYLALALVVGSTGFLLALGFAKALGLAPGAAAGLLAGGLTSSPTLAAAQDAVRGGKVPIPEGYDADQLLTNISTGYAITYIFGLIGLILIIRFLPRILGIDLAAEAAKLEAGRKGGVEDRVFGLADIRARAYRVTVDEYIGKTIREMHALFPGKGTIEKLRRRGEMIEPSLETMLERDDEVCVVGRLDALMSAPVGPEIADHELLDVHIESCRVVALRSKVKELTFTPEQGVREYGCFLSRIQRLGVDVPFGETISFQAGDVLHVTGPAARLKALGDTIGHVEGAAEQTDLTTFAIGIALGLFVGTLSVTIGGLSIGLGSAGGLLTAGLLIGYLRALHPRFGRVPGAARWIFMELGLLIFMAGVGLRAGSGILETLAETGPKMFLAGLVVTAVPVLVGYLFGSKFLRINPVLLLGAITGSMTSGASLSIVTREANSSIPALGYTGAYAFANIFLTIAGGVILLL
ncbi:MAG: transporter [Planctomycetota bacterium]